MAEGGDGQVSGTWGGISRIRVVIGAAGGLLAMFGVFRLVSEVPVGHLLALATWLAAAVVLHDAVLSPAIVGLGALLRKVPTRARTYLQSALVAGGIVTVSAIPLIYREGRQPRVKAILDQDFGRNLAVLLGLVFVVALTSYLLRVVRERQASRSARAALAGNVDRPLER
jgi:hypothetical protein